MPKENCPLCPPWEAQHIVDRAQKLGISPRELWRQIQKDPIVREKNKQLPSIPIIPDITSYLREGTWETLSAQGELLEIP